ALRGPVLRLRQRTLQTHLPGEPRPLAGRGRWCARTTPLGGLVPPVAPRLHELHQVALGPVRLGDGRDLHHPTRVAGALETRVSARDLRADVEHEARVLLALRIEGREVALVGEGRRLPFDRLLDARIRGEHDLAHT